MHLGSLKSTQEARVALGCASSNSYASFVLSTETHASITRYTHAKHEPILNCMLDAKVDNNKLTEAQLFTRGRILPYLSSVFIVSETLSDGQF